MAERPDTDEAERARRRRAAELLGEALPSDASDDTDDPWGDARGDLRGDGGRDAQLRRDVPPHHG